MADVPEIETKDLQENVQEAHHEAAKEGAGWTRYVALSTAAFAAFAAVGALHAGSLVNRAMIDQIRAADAWNEYQADKQKSHTYTIEVNRLLDGSRDSQSGRPNVHPPSALSSRSQTGDIPLVAKLPAERILEYVDESKREIGKSKKLADEAQLDEHRAENQLDTHERFAYSVALLQVAIALGAVSAIARSKPVWFASAAVGVIGIAFFTLGFIR